MPRPKKPIFLTGIPRSGTTLCCKLLNQYNDVLALVEPIPASQWESITDPRKAADRIEQFSEQAFSDALNGFAQSKLKQGQFADNIIANKDVSGLLLSLIHI